MATSPNLMLFTCTSCFQLPNSTCRTPSSCVEIGSCFKNNQESDLGLTQKAAPVRNGNLASIQFPACFFPSAVVGSQLLAWFLTTCFSVPEMGWVRPLSQFQSLSALAMAVLESSSTRTDLKDDGREPRKVMGMTQCHSENDTWSFSVGQRRTYRQDLTGWPFDIVQPNGIKFLRLPIQASLPSNPDVFLYSNSSSFPTSFQCLAVL